MNSTAPTSVPLESSTQRFSRVTVLSRIRFYREGLGQLLAQCDGVDLRATLATDEMALRRVLEDRPDVVLVDVSSREGIEAIRVLGEQAAEVRVVAVAVSTDASEILECAQAGVAGYVTTDASMLELLSILRSVMEGELRCLPIAAAVLRHHLAAISAPQTADGDPRLTGRELEIARLLAQDLANKDIARRLHIEVSTVKSHVHNILEKLHVSRRVEAVASLRSRRATHLMCP